MKVPYERMKLIKYTSKKLKLLRRERSFETKLDPIMWTPDGASRVNEHYFEPWLLKFPCLYIQTNLASEFELDN